MAFARAVIRSGRGVRSVARSGTRRDCGVVRAALAEPPSVHSKGEGSSQAALSTQRDGARSERWQRVLLKVSGEALAGPEGFGIDSDIVQRVAREVSIVAAEGIEVAMVVGGGNFFRGKDKEGKGLDRASADYMGMLATTMNAISMQAALEACGTPTRVQTAISMQEVAEPYIRRRAMRHLEKGRVVIFAAGTGNPFFTTDTGAALRAAEIGAEVVLKATKVDGVYDKDPQKHADAKLYTQLTHAEVQEQNLGVMDLTAITLCAENDIPVVVFNISPEGNISKALSGDEIGTIVR
mmetsp:Transcript_390/g.1262  ORF Transcript_390/g.1262 Transcript_390/m.1262 type:complete len:295 (+) Transcript_390:3-887(+)